MELGEGLIERAPVRRSVKAVAFGVALTAACVGLVAFTRGIGSNPIQLVKGGDYDPPYTCQVLGLSDTEANRMWCHTNCELGTGQRPNGCWGENDCDGIPFCEAQPPPQSGSVPCTCTNGDATTAPTRTPTTAPTRAPTAAPTRAPPNTPTPTVAPTPPTRAPTVAPTMPGKYLVGGWCQAPTNPPNDHTSHKQLWGTGISIILPGSFKPDASVHVDPQWWSSVKSVPHRWITLGGENVGTIHGEYCFDEDFILGEVSRADLTGVAFDMEGCYEGQLEKVKALVGRLKQKTSGRSLVFTYVGKGDMANVPDYNALSNTFDYAAPMFYWGPSYASISNSRIEGWINNWIRKGWPKEKTFITFQSDAAYDSEKTLVYLAGKTKEGYAGILGWPSYTESKNVHNLGVLAKNGLDA